MKVLIGDVMRSKVKCLHSLRLPGCKPWESILSIYLFRVKYKMMNPKEMFLIIVDKGIYS